MAAVVTSRLCWRGKSAPSAFLRQNFGLRTRRRGATVCGVGLESAMTSLSLPVARTPRRVQDLPAPKGLPLLGNALQIKPLQLHRQLEHWATELGSPFRIQIGREPIVVWTDSELFQDVMRDRP